jgi:hypothetical protein
MARSVFSQGVIRDQIDFYFPSGSSQRTTGLTASIIQATLFVNNALMSWPLMDGASVPDSSISSGYIYFNEISGSPGFYSIRFFANKVGFWRLVMKNNSTGIEQVKEYDVTSSSNNSSGLNASFTK